MTYRQILVLQGRVKLTKTEDLGFYKTHLQSCTTNKHVWQRLKVKPYDRYKTWCLDCRDPFSDTSDLCTAPRTRLEILRANKQVLREASLLFYGENNFRFVDAEHMDEMAHKCPSRAKMIKKITLEFEATARGQNLPGRVAGECFLGLKNFSLLRMSMENM